MDQFTFREAVPSDIPQMKEIRDNVKENSLISGEINPADYEKALFEDGKGWVCLYESNVVGFSCGRLKHNDVWALFIDSRFEGRGIGNCLMRLLEDWMFSNGCAEIQLSTEAKTRAERLYRRRSWKETEPLPNQEIGFRLSRSQTEQ
jgi:ribosomal protein S18 acetylase RimI-like enzyme